MNIRRPTVSPESDYSYTDKSSGRQLSFTPKPDEAMVTFQERTSEAGLNETLQATPLLSVSQGFNLDRGFAAVYVDPDQGMQTATRSLEDRPETANSIPVMRDQDGLDRYFLPDEFTVQFRQGVGSTRLELLEPPAKTMITMIHDLVCRFPQHSHHRVVQERRFVVGVRQLKSSEYRQIVGDKGGRTHYEPCR